MKGITLTTILILLISALVSSQETTRFRLSEPLLWKAHGNSEIKKASKSGFTVNSDGGDGFITLRYHFCSDDFSFRTNLKLDSDSQVSISLLDKSEVKPFNPIWTYGVYVTPDILYPTQLSKEIPYVALDVWNPMSLLNQSRAIKVNADKSEGFIRDDLKALPYGSLYSLTVSNLGGLFRAVIQNENGMTSIVKEMKDSLPRKKVIAISTSGSPIIFEPELFAEKNCNQKGKIASKK